MLINRFKIAQKVRERERAGSNLGCEVLNVRDEESPFSSIFSNT